MTVPNMSESETSASPVEEEKNEVAIVEAAPGAAGSVDAGAVPQLAGGMPVVPIYMDCELATVAEPNAAC